MSVRMITIFRPSVTAAVTVALLGLVQVSAGSLPDMQTDYAARFEPVLKSVPALELPAKSAGLVAAARPVQKEPVALAIVHVVSRINPSALPPVVGAISRTEPSLSGKVASEASKLQPSLRTSIQLASVNPAPTTGVQVVPRLRQRACSLFRPPPIRSRPKATARSAATTPVRPVPRGIGTRRADLRL
jgi:hypothetical protein